MSSYRCPWAETNDSMRRYHDEEWGRPCHDDVKLFEMLVLEGMQSGLSWRCVLDKREAMRNAFDGFNASIIAEYNDEKIEELMGDKGIIRNRLKLKSLAANAKAFLAVQEEYGTFDAYLWSFVGGEAIVNQYELPSDIPAKTKLAEAISKDMKARGFKFMGPVVVYSLMQAIGMVDDHLTSCPYKSQR